MSIDNDFLNPELVYDVEVDQIGVYVDEHGEVHESVDVIDDDSLSPVRTYWAVFTHIKQRGRECIADCESEQAADLIAELLREKFALNHKR